MDDLTAEIVFPVRHTTKNTGIYLIIGISKASGIDEPGRPGKTHISMGICPIWSVFAVHSMGC